MESNDILMAHKASTVLASKEFPEEETADDSSNNNKATKRPAGRMASTPGKRQKVGVPPTVNSEGSPEALRQDGVNESRHIGPTAISLSADGRYQREELLDLLTPPQTSRHKSKN